MLGASVTFWLLNLYTLWAIEENNQVDHKCILNQIERSWSMSVPPITVAVPSLIKLTGFRLLL